MLNYTFDTMYSNNQSDLKYDAFRSISQNSFRQTHSDQAPSLHSPASGPSLASPSSSTVGSPSLNHAMPVSQSMYPHEYVLGPAIVDDSYSYAYESGHFDHESAFRQTKFGVPFVGKSADLSSFVTLSTVKASPTFMSLSLSNSEIIPNATAPNQKRASESSGASDSTTNPLGAQQTQRDLVFKFPTTPASAYAKSSVLNVTRCTAPASAPFLSQFSFSPPQQPCFAQPTGNAPPCIGTCLFSFNPRFPCFLATSSRNLKILY